MRYVPDGIFQPKATTREAKHDATTNMARSIIDAETTKREAKTERLRLARLARDETTPAISSTIKSIPARRKASAGKAGSGCSR